MSFAVPVTPSAVAVIDVGPTVFVETGSTTTAGGLDVPPRALSMMTSVPAVSPSRTTTASPARKNG
jgi:hypothetical protein